MPWVKIDDQFPEHGDGAAIGVLGRGLLTDMLCYANRNLTDGFVPDAVMDRLLAERDYQGNGPAVLERLQAKPVELIRRVDRGLASGWTILHYHRYQPSRREVERDRAERRAAKSEAGKIGAKKRWQRDGAADNRLNGKRVAYRVADVQQSAAHPARQTDSPVPVPVPEDQDPGLAAGPPPGGQGADPDHGARVVRLRTRPPDPAPPQVLTMLVSSLMAREAGADEADLKEAAKATCARLGLAYDAEQIRLAMDAARAMRARGQPLSARKAAGFTRIGA